MEEEVAKKKPSRIAGLLFGLFAICFCIATIVLAVLDSYYSLYTLSSAILCLGANRVCMHLQQFKKNVFENIVVTVFIFIIAVLVSLTKFSIYFLITAMFCYSLTVIAYCIFKIIHEKSKQLIIFHILCIIFSFIFSFVFFFPAIYAKHATTISNSNFIILCFTAMIIISSGKNLLFLSHKKYDKNIVVNVIRKSLVEEIVLALLILVLLCSIYFTVVEPNITSYVDALWYSFAVITTIGFGDVYVVTTFGRILSVILGISGIAVVAVFTSVIVNFYNEMNKRREQRALKKIVEEVKENDEALVEEIKEQEEQQ